jgi:transcriptional regulator with XRE-family HTH domain
MAATATRVVVARRFSPEKMRNARLWAGRTLPEVGAACGRHPETITDYEYGRRAPQATDLAAIANYLGVDVRSFFVPEEQ